MAVWSDSEKTEYRQNHSVVMPELQPMHNYALGDIKGYFDAIFDADSPEYKGLVTVAAHDTSTAEIKIVAVVPATQLGN